MSRISQQILLVWVSAIAVCIAIVKLTAIGPVILTISSRYGMGVHTFDLVTVIPITFASIFTFMKLRKASEPAPVKVKK